MSEMMRGLVLEEKGVVRLGERPVVEQIMELNGGCVDVTAVCGGPASTVAQAMALTRGGGELCSLNACYEDAVIPVSSWNSGMKTVNFRGWQVSGGREMFERCLTMISLGKFDPTLLATHIYHGSRRWKRVYGRRRNGIA